MTQDERGQGARDPASQGVELQIHRDLPWGQAECRFSAGAGVGFNGRAPQPEALIGHDKD